MTHTYAILEVSRQCFVEIKSKLKDAGYKHALKQQTSGRYLIDMHGLALMIQKEKTSDQEN